MQSFVYAMSDQSKPLIQLCECLRGCLPNIVDWESIFRIANHSLTTPALKDFVERYRGQIPEDVSNYVDEIFRRNLIRNGRLMAQVAEAAAALNEQNVQPVLLKGLAKLATSAERQIGTRIISDIDILVSHDECDSSLNALKQLGYQIISWADDERSHWYVNVKRPQDVTHIDLHIKPPGYEFFSSAATELKHHCQLVPCGQAFAYVPSPTYQALLLIVHDQLHDADYWLGKIALRHLLDLRDLARSSEGIDWKLLNSLFESKTAKNALDTQLVTLFMLLDVDVPDDLRKRFLPRVQYRRRLLQMQVPVLADVLLLLTLFMELPNYADYRAHMEFPTLSAHGTVSKPHAMRGWSNFQFLRGLMRVPHRGKI